MPNFESSHDLRDLSRTMFDYNVAQPATGMSVEQLDVAAGQHETADATAVAEATLTLRAIGREVMGQVHYN